MLVRFSTNRVRNRDDYLTNRPALRNLWYKLQIQTTSTTEEEKKGIEKRHELKKRRAKRVDRSFIYYDYFCATQLLARTKVAIDDIRAVWHIDQVGGRGENLFERKVRDKWDKVRRQVADYRGITRGGLVFPKRSHWKMRPGKCPYFHARYTHNWKVTSYDIHTLSTHKKNNELHRPTFIISH